MQSQLPVLCLKGVNFIELYKSYLKGGYKSSIDYERKPITIMRPEDLLGEKHGSSSLDKSYAFEDENKHKLTFYTSGQEKFEVFSRSGGKPKMGGLCMHCFKPFTGMSIGIPVSWEERPLQMRDEDDNIYYEVFYVFYVDREFCHPNHALKEIERDNLNRSYRTDSKYIEARKFFMLMCKLMFPDLDVTSPQPISLLKHNGGSYSDNQLEKLPPLNYNNRVILAPVKDEYIASCYKRKCN